MNSKPLCIACMIVCFITACFMETEILNFNQAITIISIAGALGILGGGKEKAFIRPPSDKGTNKKS